MIISKKIFFSSQKNERKSDFDDFQDFLFWTADIMKSKVVIR